MNSGLEFRTRLQNAKSILEFEKITIELANQLRSRYKPIHELACEGNQDILARRDFLLSHASKKTLDVGCFDGYYSIELGKQGSTVIGVDMLQICVDYAKQRVNGLQGKVSFQKSFAEQLLFESETFYTTILSHTLEHVFDHKQALKEAARVTSKKGKIIVVLPTGLGNDPTHVRHITEEEIRAELQKYGEVSATYLVGAGAGYICTKSSN